MGFLDFLGKKGDAQKAAERMKLADLPAWAAKRRSEFSGEPESADLIVKKAIASVDSLKSAVAELEKSTMQKDVPQRIVSLVTSSRDNYVSKMNKIVNSLDMTVGPTELSDMLCKSLGEVMGVDMKYGGRVTFGFQNELSKVKKELNSLVDASNNLNSQLEGRKKKLKLLGEIDDVLKEVDKGFEEITKLESLKVQSAKELEEAKKLKCRKEADAKNIENCEQVVNVNAMRGEMAALATRKQEIENFVLNVLGPLKRALKKYTKTANDKSASSSAERYAEDPAQTYLRGDDTLPELLAKVQKAIQSGGLGMEDDEREKTLKRIRSIVFPQLEKARSEHISITSRIRKLEVETRNLDLDEEIDKVRREVDGLNYRIESWPKAMERLDESVAEETKRVDGLKRALVEKLSEFTGNKCEVI